MARTAVFTVTVTMAPWLPLCRLVGLGETEHVAPRGSPLQLKDTDCENPASGETINWNVAD